MNRTTALELLSSVFKQVGTRQHGLGLIWVLTVDAGYVNGQRIIALLDEPGPG
jgi:hypothetical protein